MVQLNIGDATFQKTFTKIGFTPDDDQVSVGFKPPKGRKFVVLLLGDVDAKAVYCDVEAMLNALGFYYRGPEA